ncbi:MAG: cobaltochelatase subunit CobN [Hyphomicrobiales bacterium]
MHLLRTETRSLDETVEAVELAQTPADIVCLSFSDGDLAGLAHAWEEGREELPSLRLANLAALRHPFSVDRYVEEVVAEARFVLVRLLGGLDYWRYGVEELSRTARQHGFALAIVPGDARQDARLDAASTLPKCELARLFAYLQNGGPDNLSELLRFLADRVRGPVAWREPRPVPAFGLFEAGCRSGNGSAPKALILLYRSVLLAADTLPVTALADALASRGLSVTAAFVTSLKDGEAAGPLADWLAGARPDVIMNTTAFSARLDAGGVLDAADCPVVQVILGGSSLEQWCAGMRGLTAADLAMNVVLPEMDGRLLAGAISFKGEAGRSEALEFTRLAHCPEASRIAHAADLAGAWVKLRRLPRQERRLACVLSDYPGKGGRAGYAVGLDTPASILSIACGLREAGYAIGKMPDTAELMGRLTWQAPCPSPALAGEGGRKADGWGAASEKPPTRPLGKSFAATLPRCAEAGEDTQSQFHLPPVRKKRACRGPARGEGDVGACSMRLPDYHRLFGTLPPAFTASVMNAWGLPEDDPCVRDGAFRFRMIRSGALIVALQPDRGRVASRKSDYHDANLPPRHGYIAFYLWLREIERIDAMIHCGTHGTLEWLPGKAVALSQTCAPEVVLGPLPVVYPFIVNNPGEAAQAKRRIAAVTIGHMTPPLIDAGSHGATAELEALFDEYASAQSLDRRRARLLSTAILAKAHEFGLAQEIGLDPNGDPMEALTRLDAWLCELKDMRIGDGLHVFGKGTPSEIEGLLRALDGRFVEPGPAGAPSRGRLDVLPTGRNLFTIDPRAVPTRTAWEIGSRTANEVMTRHAQEHGDWPRNIVIDLWGSATMRTGGDDIAQGLALLGVRPLWDSASTRVSGFEILPLAKLGRPRVDVTLRISGLFRDVFPTQIALFDKAVRAVAELDEEEEDNPLAASLRAVPAQGRKLAAARIFGAASGAYGVGLAGKLAQDGSLSRRELGEAYMTATSHAYGADADSDGLEAKDAFRTRIAAADAFVHVQDMAEQDVLDADAFPEHEGGFSAAAAALGADPALYHADTSRPDRSVVRTLSEEVARVVRGRAANPRWIAGQMRHGFRGAAEIAETVDNLFAFAAMTEAVTSRQFDLVYDATCGNEAVREFLERANPEAARAIAERFTQASRRGFWASRRNSSAARLAEMMKARV